MDRVIVYVDDAAYAQQVLAPLCGRPASAHTHWVLVACAPRMTHRVSKWVSHSTRENWRTKWADKLFAQIVPTLQAPSGAVTTVVAKGPLAELTAQLQADGDSMATVAPVVDARRPKSESVGRVDGRWSSVSGTLGSVLTGFGVLWVLALE
ncbi:MAG: hypothetical protein IV087_10610 [Acidovorax sp.]|nr:hypothetical protein [Acidovorax sp.]